MSTSAERSKRRTDRLFPAFLSSGLLIGCLILGGCTGGAEGEAERPPTIPVSGTVTYKGQPVEGATVVFVPNLPQGKAASGKTDSNGAFAMTTFESEDGAVAGDYKVTVTKIKPGTGGAVADVESDEYVDPAMAGEKKPSGPEHLLPEKYSKADSSGLTATVPSSGEVKDLKFDLVD